MKILEVTAFSKGICGVWARVSQEALELKKLGHEVLVFSSNIKRGSGRIEYACSEEEVNGILVKRFKPFGSFGENSFFWDYEKEALKFKPDVIIVHAYRQYYSTKALKIAKKLGVPCILVTHAPFVNPAFRNPQTNFMVWLYDNLVGKRILKKYSKIFTIAKWEVAYLKKLGVKDSQIVYVPNGVADDYFKIKKSKKSKTKSVLFLGRIAPVKDVETLLKSFEIVLKENPKIILNLVGPVEEEYGKKIKSLVKELKLNENVIFHGGVYELKKKLEIIDSCDVFVLPSKREGMPQVLIEIMAREKIVISSTNDGGKEIVEDNATPKGVPRDISKEMSTKGNGYLFEIGDYKKLADLILKGMENSEINKKMKKEAKKSVEQFAWSKLGNRIDEVLKNLIVLNSSTIPRPPSQMK